MKIINLEVKNVLAFSDFSYRPEEHINLIYGENGVGKSTLVDIFELLSIIFQKSKLTNLLLVDDELFKKNRDSLFDLYKNFSTIGNNDAMTISFDFYHNSRKGSYSIGIDNMNRILYEKLDYAVNQRKVNIFSRNLDSGLDSKFSSLKNLVLKYDLDSKISMISFINLLLQKNIIESNLSEIQIISELADFIVCNNKYSRNLFDFEEKGALPPYQEVSYEAIQSFEEMIENNLLLEFKNFVYQIDENILDIKYKTTWNESTTTYQKELMFSKALGNQIIDIPYAKESTGTKKYIDYFNFIHLAKTNDSIYTWDEVGLSMHQNLVRKIFDYMAKVMKDNDRQIFLTSHDHNLLDSDCLNNKEKQFLVNNSGIRCVRNLVGIDNKDKVSKRYAEGYYGSIPSLSDIWEFDEH